MKDLIKFIVENADKFEYDEEGNITNLQIKDMYGNWVYFDAPDFKCGDEFRFIQKPKKVHFEYEDFIEEIKKNGGWVKTNLNIVEPVSKLSKQQINLSGLGYTYESFCNIFTRLDGTKFEKEVDNG